ncbi:hypothetical protein tinsulaeT_29340 [Thalassotalea insulae]|uniref:FecR protein domain-containing protein n=1 Tax=Thalassotalea insulae TaxID=2056778 RepID=A0ABQ6GW86_9GAMM|nr:FecR domain-containing protein [Thalassotalea insulae]GLX79594.1 hypothetical protein tinsulaeT_29340 [Thalassotalea insulae]
MSEQLITEQIKKQARHWVCCLNRGLHHEEKPQLIAWVNQSPAHHQAIYKMATFFDNISELKTLNGVFPLAQQPSIISGKDFKWLLAILVSILLIFISLPLKTMLFDSNSQSFPVQTYTTNIGEIISVELTDGSKITLNTHSQVRVSYTDNHRNINLLYGEAQFDVAKDSSRPFTVTSGSKAFTALGTIFNVQKNNESDMELIVNEGQVLVSNSQLTNHQLQTLISEEIDKFESSKIITDNEKSVISNNVQQPTNSLSKKQSANELAWQQGMLVFNGETLAQALNEVSRYSKVQFEITDSSINDVKIAGYFKAGDIDGLLAALSYNFGIKSKFNATNSVQLSQQPTKS